MTQITLEQTERDLVASLAYYESREPGLGPALPIAAVFA